MNRTIWSTAIKITQQLNARSCEHYELVPWGWGLLMAWFGPELVFTSRIVSKHMRTKYRYIYMSFPIIARLFLYLGSRYSISSINWCNTNISYEIITTRFRTDDWCVSIDMVVTEDRVRSEYDLPYRNPRPTSLKSHFQPCWWRMRSWPE